MAFHFAARRAEHPARGDGAGGGAGGAGLHLRRAERARHVLPRQDHHRALLVPRDILPERAAVRLSLFPLQPGHSSCQGRGCVADPAGRPYRRCRSAVARHRKRRRQAVVAGRSVVAVARRPRAVDPEHSGAGRRRRCRGRGSRFRAARQVDRAHRHGAVGVRAGSPSGNGPDAGAPAEADRQPAAVPGERGGAAVDRGCGRRPAVAPQRKDRLRPARSAGEGQGRDRHRRWRLDRFGDLRPAGDVRCRAAADHRELRTRAIRHSRSADRQGDADRDRRPHRGHPRS